MDCRYAGHGRLHQGCKSVCCLWPCTACIPLPQPSPQPSPQPPPQPSPHLGSTAVDMLWAGVPVVTSAGRTMAARVAASLVAAAGVPTLVARGPADMADLTVKLLEGAIARYVMSGPGWGRNMDVSRWMAADGDEEEPLQLQLCLAAWHRACVLAVRCACWRYTLRGRAAAAAARVCARCGVLRCGCDARRCVHNGLHCAASLPALAQGRPATAWSTWYMVGHHGACPMEIQGSGSMAHREHTGSMAHMEHTGSMAHREHTGSMAHRERTGSMAHMSMEIHAAGTW
jgi:hypothetical protein